MPYNPPASNTQSGNGANLYLLASGSGGAGDVIDGNLTVTGNIIGNGSLTIAGASNLNGAVTAVSLSSPGAVSAATVSSSGAMSCGSLSSPGAVSAGTLSSSGGVNGATVTASGVISAGSVASTGNIVSSAGGVSGQTFTNSSLTQSTIALVLAGVSQSSAVVIGPSGAGNNLLAINLQSLFPNINNFKMYRLFLSGSASNRFSGMTLGYGGAGSAGSFIPQWQSVSGLVPFTSNYKGNVSVLGVSAPASPPGTIAVYPDNVIVTNADLTNSTIYYGGTFSNGATGGFNDGAANVWMTIVPIL